MRFGNPLNRGIARCQGEIGATMVEAALTIFLFLVFIFFFIDLGRFFFSYAVLNYAAHISLDRITKDVIENDISQKGCSAAPDGSKKCSEFKTALQFAQSEGERIALLAGCPPGTNCGVILYAFRQYKMEDYDNNPPVSRYNNCDATVCTTDGLETRVLILRPGEIGWRQEPDGTEVAVDHPTWPSTNGWPESSATESWSDLLSREPIIVRVEASFDFFTPGLGKRNIVATMAGFRRGLNTGRTRRVDTPTPTATANPLATSTPTAIPTPNVTPTPTPTPEPCPELCLAIPLPGRCAYCDSCAKFSLCECQPCGGN